jgi:hypothetical protein
MSSNFSSLRQRAQFKRLPLDVWHDPSTSLPQLSSQELAGSDEIEILAISRDDNRYAVRHDDGLGWVLKDDIELPEPSLEVPKGLDKVGLCANQALTPNGEIAARLQDPSVIADSGVRWVRLNFMQIGDRWLERYGEIVDGLRERGLQIYATLSHDVIGHPGLIMQQAPQGAPDRWPDNHPEHVRWIERYIEVCDEILEAFEGRIGVYETLNEPDLWMEGKSWMHPHWFAYTQDRLYRQLKPGYPVKIVSGPLQGTTSGNSAPPYLKAMYEFGRRHLRWRQDGSPFDGVAYHIYNWPGNWGGTPEEAQELYRAYLDELWGVIVRFEEQDTDKKIYVSEFGYPSTIEVNEPKAQEEWQATMMGAAIELLADDERVALASWFCAEDFDSPGEMFGLYVNGRGAKPTDCKRAFFTLRDLMTGGSEEARSGVRGFA